jgi:hypothetical protein
MASTGPASQSSSLSQSTGSGPLARVGLDGSLGQNVALADARRSILQQFGAKKDGNMDLGQVIWTLVSDSYGNMPALGVRFLLISPYKY